MKILITGACAVSARSVLRSLKMSGKFGGSEFVGWDMCNLLYGVYEGVFDRIYKVLAGSFKLPDKDTARRYFLELRQLFMDWNYLPFDSEEFRKQEAGIEAKIAERSTVNA